MRLRNAVFLSALLIGLATMTGITAIRGVLESQRVEREIAADLETESFVHLGAISEALWIFDHTLLQAVLDGIIAGPNISYAAVVDKDAVVAAAGAERAGAEYTRRTPVLYQDRGTSRTIGTLIVQGDLGVLRDRSRAWILKDLPPIAAGILLCALLIALSFEILVTRRLERDARAFVSYDFTGAAASQLAPRTPPRDEIDVLEARFLELLGALRAGLDEKDALIRELYHRTNNSMQSILGLLAIGKGSLRETVSIEVFSRIEKKVYAMALVHHMLYEKGDLSRISLPEYVSAYAAYLSAEERVAERGILLDLRIQEVEVSIDFAVPFGLIVSELTGNALRHGFPHGRGGRVDISLKTEDDGRIVFTVSDDGVGTELDLNGGGGGELGIELARSLASDQLGGSLRFETGPGRGVRSVLEAYPSRFRPRV